MKITFVSQPEYFNCCLPDKLPDCTITKIHFKDLKLNELEAYIFFLFRPDMIPIELIKSLKGKRAWISSEPIERRDVLPSYEALRRRFNSWDMVTHYDRTHLAQLNRIGIRAKEFTLPVNLHILHPTNSFQDFDLFFAGRSTEHREHLIGTLKRDYNFFHAAHGLIDNDFRTFVSRSKICLNLNIEGYAQLQHRLQNLLACGAFVLSEKQSHTDKLKPGIHYIEFSGAHDLQEKVDYYLNHPQEREMIAAQGNEYVKQNFNSEILWKELIDQILPRLMPVVENGANMVS